ncbi:MAG: cyanophycinase [Oscillatoriaceae cyanobacterium Prado104]|jgi:cyanophycinase|nr:cyanophycinase [Oscillatoriaceae cyanobacterium Prado104]
MQQLTSQALERDIPQRTKTSIMVIGGAEDKVHGREILNTFFYRAGGSNARLAIIPCASRDPEGIGTRYRTIFDEMGVTSVKVVDVREREQGENPVWKDYLEDCTGVFMTGGDQLRLCGLLADTPVMEKIRKETLEGKIALAGTSAGAAVMGYHMIAGGGSGASPNRSLVDMANGLNIIPEIIVDQHFHNRNRMARLLSAVACHPDRIAIGVDEDTCALFEGDDTMKILGKGTVTVVDSREMIYTNEPYVGATDPLSMFNLRLHVLCHGDSYNIPLGKPISSAASSRADLENAARLTNKEHNSY